MEPCQIDKQWLTQARLISTTIESSLRDHDHMISYTAAFSPKATELLERYQNMK